VLIKYALKKYKYKFRYVFIKKNNIPIRSISENVNNYYTKRKLYN
jgi:hypothetical protein